MLWILTRQLHLLFLFRIQRLKTSPSSLLSHWLDQIWSLLRRRRSCESASTNRVGMILYPICYCRLSVWSILCVGSFQINTFHISKLIFLQVKGAIAMLLVTHHSLWAPELSIMMPFYAPDSRIIALCIFCCPVCGAELSRCWVTHGGSSFPPLCRHHNHPAVVVSDSTRPKKGTFGDIWPI